ncbi:hypothetical protein DFH08DRAFT_882134 [Mycena albidolilacea]|uniref:Uncharacterized protein n=1 Tax=Mycena albidolilacea TaxID=1033008 RepID=A0AAD7EK59_9AGAR|nr:hypothetical protein DFH08DRAFT_882134 [Mycena albidolilacea]
MSVSEFVPVISVSEPASAPVPTPFIGHLPILPPGGVFPKRADFVPVPELSPVVLQTDPPATPSPSPTIVIPFSELTAFVPSPATTPFVPDPVESSEFVPVPSPTSEFVPVPVLSVPPPPPVPTVIIGHLPILPPGGVFPKRVPDEAGAIPG